MIKFLVAFNLVIWSVVGFELAHAEPISKKVCHEEKGKQVCKTIKTHKKVEGTPVPEKAPVQPKKKK